MLFCKEFRCGWMPLLQICIQEIADLHPKEGKCLQKQTTLYLNRAEIFTLKLKNFEGKSWEVKSTGFHICILLQQYFLCNEWYRMHYLLFTHVKWIRRAIECWKIFCIHPHSLLTVSIIFVYHDVNSTFKLSFFYLNFYIL